MSATVRQRQNWNHRIALVLVLLLLLSITAQFVKSASANPYWYYESGSPPYDAKPPTISIMTLKNNTVYASNNISLTFNVSIPEPKYSLRLMEIRYQTNWSETIPILYQNTNGYGPDITDFSDNLTLTDIPEGNHNITFIAAAEGVYSADLVGKLFSLTNASRIYFSVDITPPTVRVFSIENKTYEKFDAPLNFTVNESFSQTKYSLDKQENMTISNNTTFANLTYGMHNITVYAWDNAGNIGASETIEFTIESPKPNLFESLTITIFIIATMIIVTSLLLYRRQRKTKQLKSMTFS